VKIEPYFQAKVGELRTLVARGDPWVFLCASSFIEYLAKMSIGKTTSAKDYKDFLNNQFFRVCPEYAAFRYRSGKHDLAEQMYHVLRCGIVHSFSLFADPLAKSKHGGRDRSIILAHRHSASGRKHLENWIDNRRKPKLDAALFIAEDFIEDVAKVTTDLFVESRKNTLAGRDLQKNIQAWVRAYPPIGSLIL
jgi:hypothetical protein